MFMRMVYDDKLAQAAYLIGCQKTGEAIVIDPERDVDRYIDLAQANGLRIVATAETHIHADFVSGSRELAERIGAKVYVSDEGDAAWKYQWLDKKLGGGSYDHTLLHDGDTFSIGNIDFKVIHTPGHTPEHIVFVVTDRGGGATEPIGVATGDFLFVGDLGRPDLLESATGVAGMMEPSARQLFTTLKKLDSIPDYVQVWPAHGAGSACGKALGAVPTSTVGYEKRFNPAIKAATSQQNFVDFILEGQPEPPLYFANMKRDNKLGPPVLGGLPTPPRVTAGALRHLDTKTITLIDTRPWDEFRKGHVPGSIWLPMGNLFNTFAGSFVRDTDEIYLIIDPAKLVEAVRDLIRVGLDHLKGWFDASDIALYPDSSHAFDTLDEVSASEAGKFLAESNAQVLDVRRATEFAGGHIEGATNIAHTRLAGRMDDVPTGSNLLVNCLGGVRSAAAASHLKRNGYEVTNLKGGIQAWNKVQPQTAQQ